MSSANLARSEKALSLGITAEEWALRVQLAACYRIFDLLGWTEYIFNHITLRVPGPEKHFLINPFGLWYSEVTASNLVKIDLDGNTVGKSEYPVNKAGFVIHSAIHAVRPDAHCIMHTHTTAGVAVACQEQGITPNNFYGSQLHGRIAYHDFEGISVELDERPRLVKSLGDRNVMVLRNHGLLVCGGGVAEALRGCSTCSAPARSSLPPKRRASRSPRSRSRFASGRRRRAKPSIPPAMAADCSPRSSAASTGSTPATANERRLTAQ